MSLFNFKKKKEEKCCCGGNCNGENMNKARESHSSGARIKILGSGCKKCDDLMESVKKALKDLNKDMEVDHVTDFVTIASYGVMSTPALVVDGKVVSYGKVLTPEEVVSLIKDLI